MATMRRTDINRKLDNEETKVSDAIQAIASEELDKLFFAIIRNLRRVKRPAAGTIRKNISFQTLEKGYNIAPSPWDVFRDNMRRRLKAEIAAGTITLAMLSALKVTSEPVSIDSYDIAEGLEDAIGTRITFVTRAIRRETARKVVAWYNAPESTMGHIINSLAPTFGVARAARIAQTEITSLDTKVQDVISDKLGLDEWVWETKRDQIVCTEKLNGPDGQIYNGCRALHGKVFHRTQPGPPEGSHIGCRCKKRLLVPRPAASRPDGLIVDTSHLDMEKWEEGSHPRKNDGKFAPKGQGESGGSKPQPTGEKIQARPPIAPPDHPAVIEHRKKYYSDSVEKIVDFLSHRGFNNKTARTAYTNFFNAFDKGNDTFTEYKGYLKEIDSVVSSSNGVIDAKEWKDLKESIRVGDWRAIKGMKLEPKPVKVDPTQAIDHGQAANDIHEKAMEMMKPENLPAGISAKYQEYNQEYLKWKENDEVIRDLKNQYFEGQLSKEERKNYVETANNANGNLANMRNLREEINNHPDNPAKKIHAMLELPEGDRKPIEFDRRQIDIAATEKVQSSTDWISSHMKFPDVIGYGGKKASIHYKTDVYTSRCFYDMDGSINLTVNVNNTSITHETGHYLEHRFPEIHAAALAFRARRAGNESPVKMNDLSGKTYDEREITLKDNFADPYCGKVYKDAATEIISMGMQYMYERPGEFAQEDPDYFKFMVNIMRGKYD